MGEDVIDSSGRSSLGDMKRSSLGEFQKQVVPTQKHIGTVEINEPVTGPSIFLLGESLYLCTISNVSVGFPCEGYIKLSLDLETIEDTAFFAASALGDIDPAFISPVNVLAIGNVIYFETFDHNFGVMEVAVNVATRKYAVHSFYDYVFNGGLVTDAFDTGTSIAHHFDVLPVVDEPPGFLVAGYNGTITRVETYAHTPAFLSRGCAYDGSSFYMIGTFSGSSDHFVVAKIAADYSVTQIVKYTLPSGGGLITDRKHRHAIVDDVLVIAVFRTGVPVWIGIDTSDLENILWSWSGRKQTSTATIGINDATTTYRITIGAQTEQVAGNAGGASATATDLANQCAASAQSQFVARTWTVDANVVTATANIAGVLFSMSVSKVGGTGTITLAETFNASFTAPSAAAAAGSDVVFVGQTPYAVAKIDSLTGDVQSFGQVNQSTGFGILTGVTVIDLIAYCIGRTGSAANRFGGSGDFDIEVLPIIDFPTDASLLTDDLSWTVSTESLTRSTVTTGFPSIRDTQVDLDTPSDTFLTANSNYTF